MATYDVLSVYPEGKDCDCCGKKISKKFYITITGRTVCSLNCKNNLKSSPEDSCYICKKPVWEGTCYATKTKFLCSDKCKNDYLKERGARNSLKGPYSKIGQGASTEENMISLKVKYGSPFSAQSKEFKSYD